MAVLIEIQELVEIQELTIIESVLTDGMIDCVTLATSGSLSC